MLTLYRPDYYKVNYRFPPAFGETPGGPEDHQRIDHLLVTESVSQKTVWADIDREARKGNPIPSDHAPLVIDIDEPGRPFDAGWATAEGRIAARRDK